MSTNRGPGFVSQAEYEHATQDVLARYEGSLDRDSFRAVWLLHQAADAARSFQTANVLDEYGLSWPQFEVVWNLWLFGERDAGWVAQAAMVSKSGLTTILAQLSARNLVTRRGDPDDARRSLVRLSDEGDRMMLDLFRLMNTVEKQFASALDDDGKRHLADLLSALLAGWEDRRAQP
ncbi:MAG: MarR family winged helix-turn-helix transcriptional regulator [Candidatus Microbacterium phytovorans]|uniref:MarR family winged helix-turn-helix transcriptional regulator n=1 Tax=Candidatus Microbacterium phytovorans TaxID=3121374 RepID=A0AAJ5W306_9MICO|nr:MarR family winged helix-turn-helix transcriptional regulator [Microbacterium sp.]WEK13888.1 MAG: MarR family winged helix-turn-helix transcriptional regulator [Microbacterium sp.]